MKKQFLIIAMFPLICFSQNEIDALRYSTTFFSGTARYNAMAGAFGALGGDVSTLSTNPAGIGIYRSSEFVFTPQFSNNMSSASYQNLTTDDINFKMNFANVGFVATHNNGKEEGWITTSFGLAYNKLADFNNYTKIEGINNSSSMTDYFAALANGKKYGNLDYFREGLAWDAYIIDPANPDTTSYKSAFSKYGLKQSKSISRKGSIGEYVIALGGNYSNKLYMGGTVGIQTVRYVENSFYEEKDVNDSIPNFNNFEYKNDLKTTGSGFNFKFGMIFRPVDMVRIGIAIHSPTFYNLHDEYSSSIKSSYSDALHGDGSINKSPEGAYDYQLTSPFKAIGSIGLVFGKVGLLGVEYEFVDYTTARLRANDYFFGSENNSIETEYTQTGNIKIGGEIKYGALSFRAGYGLYGSPYRAGHINENAITSSYNAGFGIKSNDFYFDMAFNYTTSSEKYFLYDPYVINIPSVDVNNSNIKVLVTFGFKFWFFFHIV